MELVVKRNKFTAQSTEGELLIDGIHECFTLEDVDRKLEAGGVKIFGQTAIPRGRYKVTESFSNHFQKTLPEVLNVPQYAGVRIHSGNTATDTEGCILVGTQEGNDIILHSRDAFEKLNEKIIAAIKIGDVFITVE